MRKTKSKATQQVENPLEKLLGVGLGGLDEYLGFVDSKEKQKRHEGDLFEGQELNLKEIQGKKLEEQKKEKEKPYVEAAINYSREIIHLGERAAKRTNQELDAQLREIMAEIKKLADSSKELQMQFKEVAVEQHAKAPGKYHKSFFSWLLTVIRTARMKVEDSQSWLAALQSKKKSREYGAMAKKQGTSFTLNNERTVATQVG